MTCKNFSSLASGAGAARRGSCGNVRRRLSHLMSVLSVMQCHVKCCAFAVPIYGAQILSRGVRVNMKAITQCTR